mmetsp:Transcript_89113/g.252650  ORF Transcript_89113/g.252650 Transcript_89113/m.252650 type:complete len:215 (+) Transcript_89113:1398-2042(+)
MPKLPAELAQELVRFFLRASLALLHCHDDPDLFLRDAGGGDALERQLEDIDGLLVVGQYHKVQDVVPPRARLRAPLALPHLVAVQRLEVRVLIVRHLLEAHVREQRDVRPQLPALVHCEGRGDDECAIRPAFEEQHDGGPDEQHAEAQRKQAAHRSEPGAHVDEVELPGLQRIWLLNVVLLDDVHHELVRLECAGPRRQQRRVEPGRARRGQPL